MPEQSHRIQDHDNRASLVGDCAASIDYAVIAAYIQDMRTFTAVVERDPETKLFVGYIPGFPGAHSQGVSLDELSENLREVIAMLLEDGDPRLEAEFVGTQAITV